MAAWKMRYARRENLYETYIGLCFVYVKRKVMLPDGRYSLNNPNVCGPWRGDYKDAIAGRVARGSRTHRSGYRNSEVPRGFGASVVC